MKFAHDKTGRHLRRYELITQRCPSILVWHAKPHALVIRNLPSLNIATFSTLEFLHDLPGHASVILPFRGPAEEGIQLLCGPVEGVGVGRHCAKPMLG